MGFKKPGFKDRSKPVSEVTYGNKLLEKSEQLVKKWF
jgi:hypothetical protein